MAQASTHACLLLMAGMAACADAFLTTAPPLPRVREGAAGPWGATATGARRLSAAGPRMKGGGQNPDEQQKEAFERSRKRIEAEKSVKGAPGRASPPSSLASTHRPASRRDAIAGAASCAILWGQPSPATSKDLPPYTSNFTLTESGLKFRDVREGTGPQVAPGCRVNFHFVGRLAGRNGKAFEDSTQGEPFRATLGKGQLIQGLEEGMVGMRVGGSRRMLIPGEIGYMDRKQGPIPRDFGMRNRLYSTVFNTERTSKEREALGASIAGVVLADVQVLRVFCGEGD